MAATKRRKEKKEQKKELPNIHNSREKGKKLLRGREKNAAHAPRPIEKGEKRKNKLDGEGSEASSS